jgi:chorismate mutase / prephenate dehydratase
MTELDLLRDGLDEIDAKLAVLFQDRMDTVRKIGAYKQARGMAILQESREAAVIRHTLSCLRLSSDAPYMRDLFEQIMRISKACQAAMGEKPKITPAVPVTAGLPVGFPGAEGSFSEEAAAAFFGDSPIYRAYETFEDTLRAAADGEIPYAVLPIENSSAGAVTDTHDLLLAYNLHIVGEQRLPIAHHLLGIPGSTLEGIREAHSHSQALAQCKDFLAAHPAIVPVPSLNTALSARAVQAWNDPGKAAIAGARAAQRYGLVTLAGNIHGNPFNATRFVIVSREPAALQPANKATVAFRTPNAVGALAELLRCFAEHGLNMSRIESRPIRGKPWEYAFIVDFNEVADANCLSQALKAASAYSLDLRLLGMYAAAV